MRHQNTPAGQAQLPPLQMLLVVRSVRLLLLQAVPSDAMALRLQHAPSPARQWCSFRTQSSLTT
jgi:hypothetical protein